MYRYDMDFISYLLNNLAYKIVPPLFTLSNVLMCCAGRYRSLVRGILAIVLFLISCAISWIYDDGGIYGVVVILLALFGFLFFYFQGVSARKLENEHHRAPSTSSKE